MKIWRLVDIDGEKSTHFDGPPVADSYTLCGMDTAGDPMIYMEDPIMIEGKVDCAQCLAIVKYCKGLKP